MPAAAREPSYEVLAGLVVELRAELTQARAEIGELKARLAQSSKNSSKPPSSDGLAKPAPKSLRGRSGRRPGGQAGHPGATLRQVAEPDEVVRHEPAACRACGDSLAGAPRVGVRRRQEFDVPPIQVRVTEHQLIERRCACGTATCGVAPAGIDSLVQYGPRITAIIVYLYAGQFLSKARTAKALSELFGTPVSGGTVAAATERAAGGLGGFLELVRDRIAGADVAHFDETGLRVDGRLRWVHSASTGKYSLITVHDKRGTAAMDAAGVLPAFTGVAVHDAWAPYDTYTAARHALCNAHVLRELQAVTDHHAGGSWCWATQVADALRELKTLAENATGTVNPAGLAAAVHRYRSAALIGAQATAARTGKLMAKHHALARRLIDRQDDYLRFVTDPRTPFDNNAAEREIRMVKLRQKVSGCLRTLTGAEQFCAIRSYLATAAKHGLAFLDALVRLTNGRPWTPAIS